jgi:hypothetical protein
MNATRTQVGPYATRRRATCILVNNTPKSVNILGLFMPIEVAAEQRPNIPDESFFLSGRVIPTGEPLQRARHVVPVSPSSVAQQGLYVCQVVVAISIIERVVIPFGWESNGEKPNQDVDGVRAPASCGVELTLPGCVKWIVSARVHIANRIIVVEAVSVQRLRVTCLWYNRIRLDPPVNITVGVTRVLGGQVHAPAGGRARGDNRQRGGGGGRVARERPVATVQYGPAVPPFGRSLGRYMPGLGRRRPVRDQGRHRYRVAWRSGSATRVSHLQVEQSRLTLESQKPPALCPRLAALSNCASPLPSPIAPRIVTPARKVSLKVSGRIPRHYRLDPHSCRP